MKIVVSTKGTSLNSDVDPRFGRAAGFFLYDTDTGNTTYLDNSPHRDLSQSTGIKSTQMIIEAGTDVLITGQMGPKAAQVLNRSKVEIYICTTGTIHEAIQSLEQNRLKQLGKDDVHPGPGKMGGRGIGGGGRGRGPA